MEPRWKGKWGGARFLGGAGRLDIHYFLGGDLRLVWGNHSEEWHWAIFDETGLRIDGLTALLRDPPTDEELKMTEHYLELFAPDAVARMKGDWA